MGVFVVSMVPMVVVPVVFGCVGLHYVLCVFSSLICPSSVLISGTALCGFPYLDMGTVISMWFFIVILVFIFLICWFV